MTREEAKAILEEVSVIDDSIWQYDPHYLQALQVAITALQAQDVDAVSRQAVMWMLTNLSYTQCRTQGEVEVIGVAKTLLIAMPSAQEVNNSNQEVNNSTATQPNGIESQASYRQVTGKLDVTDCISRQAAINAIENTDCELSPCAWNELTDAIMRVPSVQPIHTNTPNTLKSLDCIDRRAAIDEIEERKNANGYSNVALISELNRLEGYIMRLPSAQPEPMSEPYMKAVWTWLLDYQIKAAELKGKYTPYEVLSWVANDWRKEHE